MRWMVSVVVVVKIMMIEHGNLQLQAAGKHCKLYYKDFSFSRIVCVFHGVYHLSWPHQTISQHFRPVANLFLLKGFDFRLIVFVYKRHQ
ncbi:hypothetical protein L1987_56983 [Smallanthus sonchifolius]|uniref:Uncharacterized protein n=1 Tax=Smallanthus sonchifolius TaxID=185202 RepID=A0ACB9DC04_9ASTR|nr:hypothetical protein L1987_56983 [Smallanthus sonchifolius]